LLVWNPSGIEETSMKAYLAVVLLVPGLTARAQTPAEAIAHAPDGGTLTRIQSIAVLPLTNASFSATVTTEWTRILADGSTATMKNHRTIARDSTGRIFEERRSFAPNGDTQPTRIDALEYSDPNRHEFYRCIPQQKTCYASKYLRPAMPSMPAGMDGLGLCGCASAPGTGIQITHEPLGQKTIEDVNVTGSREITTLPAGQFGNAKAQPIVKEFWYSPRLGLNIVTERFDPRAGTENFVVSRIALDEPDPAMFQPPADYQILREVVERPATGRPAQ
jgi:hypothetical protein